MSDLSVVIAERIRSTRLARGLGLVELSGKLGITNSRLANWESGLRRPRYESLNALAKELGVSVAWLSGAEDVDGSQPRADNFIAPANSYRGESATPQLGSLALSPDYLARRNLDPQNLLVVRLPTDDEVIIDQSSNKVTVAARYALEANDHLFIRSIRPDLDGSYLVTSEDDQQTKRLTADQLAELKIIGRVVLIAQNV